MRQIPRERVSKAVPRVGFFRASIWPAVVRDANSKPGGNRDEESGAIGAASGGSDARAPGTLLADVSQP